jgi:hypothetical protein
MRISILRRLIRATMHGRNRERILATETTALARSKPQYLDEDFDTIHEAVLETARGRWFLQEYARRNRAADTEMLLGALARIEQAMAGHAAAASEPAPLPDLQLLELRDAIALTRDNLTALGAKSRAIGSGDFAGVATAVGNTATRLRAAFERLQETAWTLRDRDGAASLCDALEAQARELASLSGLLDEVGAGAAVMGDLLNEIEQRVGAMIARIDPRNDAPERSQARPQRADETPPPEMPSPAPQAATPPELEADRDELEQHELEQDEPQPDESGGAIILAFDPDYERMMSEAVDAALVSECEGAEWHLPAVAAAEPAAVLVETPRADSTAPAAVETAAEPDLSDQVFETLSAEAAPQAAASTADALDPSSRAWIETLAPAVRSAENAAPRPFEDIEFPLANGKSVSVPDEAPKTLPNIASRDRDEEQTASAAGQAAAILQDEIEAAMADIRDAVQAQLREDIRPQTAQPARPADPLAPLVALSEEEKIALFT